MNIAKIKKQKILITGGSGFIGSAITKYLVKEGHSVTVYDNNSRGKIRRLNEVKNKIKFIKGDIRDYRKLITRLDDFKDMSPDEIKVKLDQIYDWNDKSN